VQRLDVTNKAFAPVAWVAVSADGRRLAAVSRADTRVINLVDTASGVVLHSLTHGVEVVHVAFSHDNRRLATSAAAWKGEKDVQREVRVWDAETGQPLTTIPCHQYLPPGAYGTVGLSPDGRWLAYDEYVPGPAEKGQAGLTCRVCVRDLESG